MLSVEAESVLLHQDSRGSVFEPLDPERLRSQRNVHVVITEPGHVRGNHYHTRETEVLTVQGPALVRLREGQGLRDIIVSEGTVSRFIVPPGVAHAIQNIGSRPTLLVAFRDRAYDPASPDVVREVLIED
ncbi:MAG TPA: cupin domain-containing protein [Alphaproteobacteria bacterium]|nr:cupin domain-containing protein [Alphaproteobacteria bacterium]